MSSDPPSESAPGHWPSMARAWAQTGPPLRPSAEDAAAYFQRCQEWIGRHGPPRVLLLGVTPEIYRLPWPAGHDFLAVDHTAAMIAHVWPGSPDQVIRADWLDLPLPAGSRDLVLCDGGLVLLDHPRGQRLLVARLQEIVAPGGRCIFRLFVPPAERESPDTVLADFLAGRVPNLNVLKLRLGMAMQSSLEAGIRVHAVWSRLRELAGDGWASLAARVGWTVEHLSFIDAYFQSGACYHFVSVAEAEELFCEGGRFVCAGVHAASYPLGERCPMVVFERR